MAGKTSSETAKPAAKRARMIDIAQVAGVSRPAVSAVLSGTGKGNILVSEKTAAKIRRIAKQLNFHPNHAAQQLAGKRSGVLAALASNWFFVPVRARFLAFLNKHADARGQRILTWQSNLRREPVEQFRREFYGRGIDGLIYLAFDNDAEWPAVVPLLAQLPHVVSVMSDPGIPGGSCVLSDVADGARQAVEHFHQQGRRKIVEVLEGLDTRLNLQRHEAFCQAHEKLGRPLDADQLLIATRGWNETDLPKFVALVDDMVHQRHADAILADNDVGAALFIRALSELGLRAPDDVAVIGWGDETISRFINPTLTTLGYGLDEMMDTTLDIMAGLIENPDRTEPKSVTIKPKLIVRESA